MRLGEAPARVGAAAALPDAPEAQQLAALPGRGRLDALLDALREELGDGGGTLPRATLAPGATPRNEWEQIGLEGFRTAGDPGRQFSGRSLADTVFSEGQINQLANQASESTIAQYRAAEDAIRNAAGAGGRVDPGALAALRARANIESAASAQGIRRDATLQAAALNAEQAARAAENERANFATDIEVRLGLGQLGLDRATAAAQVGGQRAALDQARELAGYEGEIRQRADDLVSGANRDRLRADMLRAALEGELGAREQDIGYEVERGRQGLTARGQTLDYASERGRQALAARGQNVEQRQQDIQRQLAEFEGTIRQRADDLERSYRQAGLSADMARTRAQLALEAQRLQLEQALGLGRLGLEAREQDLRHAEAARGQDIEQTLALGRLGLDTYRAAGELEQQASDRAARIYEIDRRLEDSGLDRSSREMLERERLALSRELAELERAQRESEFARNLELQGQQLGLQERELAERGRQFDASLAQEGEQFGRRLEFEGEQGRLNRNLAREGRYADEYGRWRIPPTSVPATATLRRPGAAIGAAPYNDRASLFQGWSDRIMQGVQAGTLDYEAAIAALRDLARELQLA